MGTKVLKSRWAVTVQWNESVFDFLRRLTTFLAADPVNSFTNTDNMGRSKTQTINAIGQITRVINRMGTEMNVVFDAAGIIRESRRQWVKPKR